MKHFIPAFFLQNKNKYAALFLMALVVAVFSFPELNFSYDSGIDPSLKWLYNHLFSEGLTMGRGIIFPHGPLAFFMYPLAQNFLLVASITAVLQMVFVFQLFPLIGGEKKSDWLLTAALAWLVFSLSNFNQLVISNVTIAYLLFLKNGKPVNKYIGLLLTAFAFYVKVWLAIITGTLTFSLLVIVFFRNKNYRQLVIDAGVLLVLVYLFWIAIYGSLSGFVDHCIGMFYLAGDNSAAAAYHPRNNWLLAAPFLLLTLVLPFVQKTKDGKTFGLLFILSFFAAWKYGMAREDYSHVQVYLFFLLVSMILFVVYNRKKFVLNISLIVATAVLFALNMKNVENPQPLSFHYSGIGNFTKFIFSYSEIKETSEQQNLKNIESNRLPEAIRETIAGATVDIYPWDYTIVAANQLNWKARPVIQSYAAYTSWLDGKNAKHFSGAEAPEYFIFDLNKVTFDVNGGKLESIDNRYLLNDEPQTIIEIIRNYNRVYSDENFLVFQKRAHPLEIYLTETVAQQAKWHEWIAVPDSSTGFTRLKLHLNKSFSGKLKSMFYKDELYYVYYKTDDGQTFKYRIVPKNAVDGIWVAPFYTSAGNDSPSAKISEIMVVCSDKNRVQNPFLLQWQYFDTDGATIDHFFGKDSICRPQLYLSENFGFGEENANWKGYNAKKVVHYSYYKQKAYRVDPEIFSPSFSFNTDSLSALPARITVDCWLKTYRGASANLVIETEKVPGEKKWHGIEINRQIVNINELNHISNFLDLNEPGTQVSVYIWNNGKKSVMVYGLGVKVTEKQCGLH